MAYSTPSNARAAAKAALAKVDAATIEALGLKVGTPARIPTGGMALYSAIISHTAPRSSIDPQVVEALEAKCKLVEGDDADEADEPAPAPKRAGRKTAAKKAPAKKGSARKAKAKAKDDGTPRVNKTAMALKLMARAKGVTATALIDEFEWLPHTLRGFVSLTNKKRRETGDTEITTVRENGVTSYIIKG